MRPTGESYYYRAVRDAVWLDDARELTPEERHIAVAVADHMSDEPRAFPSHARIAEMTGYSRTTVKKALGPRGRLCGGQRPLFEVVGRTGRTNRVHVYQLAPWLIVRAMDLESKRGVSRPIQRVASRPIQPNGSPRDPETGRLATLERVASRPRNPSGEPPSEPEEKSGARHVYRDGLAGLRASIRPAGGS